MPRTNLLDDVAYFNLILRQARRNGTPRERLIQLKEQFRSKLVRAASRAFDYGDFVRSAQLYAIAGVKRAAASAAKRIPTLKVVRTVTWRETTYRAAA